MSLRIIGGDRQTGKTELMLSYLASDAERTGRRSLYIVPYTSYVKHADLWLIEHKRRGVITKLPAQYQSLRGGDWVSIGWDEPGPTWPELHKRIARPDTTTYLTIRTPGSLWEYERP